MESSEEFETNPNIVEVKTKTDMPRSKSFWKSKTQKFILEPLETTPEHEKIKVMGVHKL